MTALLEVNAISKRFGGLHAVSQVSFSIAQGSISAVIGPNGAGKTTLFNLVTGCLPPTDGRIRLEGCDITGVPPFRIAALGVVRTFQLVRVFPDMTVSENLTRRFAPVHTWRRLVGDLPAALGARSRCAQPSSGAGSFLNWSGLRRWPT